MKTYCPECHVHESGVHNEAVYCSCCGAVLVDPPPKKECPDCNELNAARSNYCTKCRHYFGEKVSAYISTMPSSLRYGGVNVVKLAALLPVKKLDFKEVRDLVKAQSATLTRLALKVGRDKLAQNDPEETSGG